MVIRAHSSVGNEIEGGRRCNDQAAEDSLQHIVLLCHIRWGQGHPTLTELGCVAFAIACFSYACMLFERFQIPKHGRYQFCDRRMNVDSTLDHGVRSVSVHHI